MPKTVNELMNSLGLTPAQKIKLKKEIKRAGGIRTQSSDSIRAAASMVKSKKTQSKGPAGKVMKKRSGGIINKVIDKRTPMSGGRDRKDSAYKMKQGLGTTAKSSTAEKSFALKKGTRPGQKSSVQKDKTRAAQRAGKRQDKFVGTARKMSGGRGRSYSGRKLPPK